MYKEEHLDFLSELRLTVGGRLNALHILRMQQQVSSLLLLSQLVRAIA